MLGLFDTQYTPSRPYLQLVRRRNAATLLAIIRRKVQPGSIVHNDKWAAYRQLQRRLGLQHGSVNHSLQFVDPVTGVHTQHAESNWCTAKEKFKLMKGSTNPDFLMVYLQEFMWRRWYGDPHPNGCFRRLLQDIANQHPLWDKLFFNENIFTKTIEASIFKVQVYVYVYVSGLSTENL